MNSEKFMEILLGEGITEEQDIISAMTDYRKEYGPFDDDESTPPPPPSPKKLNFISPEEERVWTEAGGTLPNPKKLMDYYGRGIKNLIEDPFKTLFPIAAAVGKPEDSEALLLAKKNLGGLLDVLTSLDRGIDFITGGVFTEGKQAAKQLVPGGENIVSTTARNLIDVGTDPSTYVGVGTVKKLFEKPTEAAIKTAAKQVTSPIKKGVAQITKLDERLLERTATDPDYLNRIREAAIEMDVGGFDEYVESVKNKINSINMETKIAARKEIEDINNYMDLAIEGTTSKTTNKIKDAIGVDINSVSPVSKGLDIQEAVKTGKEAIGETFGVGQAQYLDEGMMLAKTTEGGSPLTQSIGDILKESGYDGKAYRAVEKFDNSPALPNDINDAISFMELGGKAETISDAVNQLRTIRKLKGTPKPDGSFYNSVMLGKIDDAYQNVIKENLNNYNPEFAKLWEVNNTRYKNAISSLQDINKGLRIDKTGSENYISKIKNIGYDNLIEMKKVAANDENITPVWKQIQEGFMDDFVARSLDKNGNFDIEKLITNWNSVDPDVRKVITGNEKFGKINQAMKQYKINQEFLKQAQQKTKDFTNRISKMKGTIGENLTKGVTYSRLRNIGSKTAPSVEAKETLNILDEFYGTDFTSKAQEFWDARQLKISPEGEVPWLPTDTTGRSLLGIAIAKSLNLFDKIPVAGNLLSTVLGLTGQSPAGAIAIFKTLNSIVRAKNATLKAGPALLTGTALASRTVTNQNLPSRQSFR